MSTIYACQNCERHGEHDDFVLARDLTERLEPGDTYTDRECPDCGALAHPIEQDPPRQHRISLDHDHYRLHPTRAPHRDASIALSLKSQEARALERWLNLKLEGLLRTHARTAERRALRRRPRGAQRQRRPRLGATRARHAVLT